LRIAALCVQHAAGAFEDQITGSHSLPGTHHGRYPPALSPSEVRAFFFFSRRLRIPWHRASEPAGFSEHPGSGSGMLDREVATP